MIVLISESERAAFPEDAAELWRRREAHGSIRIQEGEPASFITIARIKSSARPECRRTGAALTTPIHRLSVGRRFVKSTSSGLTMQERGIGDT